MIERAWSTSMIGMPANGPSPLRAAGLVVSLAPITSATSHTVRRTERHCRSALRADSVIHLKLLTTALPGRLAATLSEPVFANHIVYNSISTYHETLTSKDCQGVIDVKYGSGLFMLVVFAACLIATESKSNAQFIQRGGGLASNIARSYVVRSSPALRIGSFARNGVQRAGGQFGGVQSFRASPQRFGGPQFGNGNGINARQLFRAGRIISRF